MFVFHLGYQPSDIHIVPSNQRATLYALQQQKFQKCRQNVTQLFCAFEGFTKQPSIQRIKEEERLCLFNNNYKEMSDTKNKWCARECRRKAPEIKLFVDKRLAQLMVDKGNPVVVEYDKMAVCHPCNNGAKMDVTRWREYRKMAVNDVQFQGTGCNKCRGKGIYKVHESLEVPNRSILGGATWARMVGAGHEIGIPDGLNGDVVIVVYW